MSTLLPFHTKIIQEIHDPSTSELVVLARGLGLRRIICTLLKIYDSPQNLILLVNATPEEETEIGEELGIMGCRKPGLRVVDYETGTSKDRCVASFLCPRRRLSHPYLGRTCTRTAASYRSHLASL